MNVLYYKQKHIQNNSMIYLSLNQGMLRSSELRDIVSPGRRYPKLLLLVCATLVILMFTWLPRSSEEKQAHGPRAFVWPANQSKEAAVWIRPKEKTELISPEVIYSFFWSKKIIQKLLFYLKDFFIPESFKTNIYHQLLTTK